MKFPQWLDVYGDKKYRGQCPPESAEQRTLFNQIRKRWPTGLGMIALHPRNEGERHWHQAMVHKAEGMTVGAADLIIPGCPSLVLELKRQDHTKSKWEDGQIEYLEAALENGAFVCVALGYEAALNAIDDWISISKQYRTTSQG